MEIPTLIIWGRHDKAIPLERGQRMHRILKGSRLEIFEGAGHCPHDEQPQQFNALALDFLAATA
jgi:pimeloyl-ACP methyl ester carboxylesterase